MIDKTKPKDGDFAVDAPANAVVQWSKYDQKCLSDGAWAVADILDKISYLNEDLFFDVIAFAVIKGMGDDPCKLQESHFEAVQSVVDHAEKAKLKNQLVAAILRGHLRCKIDGGELTFMATEAGRNFSEQGKHDLMGD